MKQYNRFSIAFERFGFRTLLVYLETLQTSVRPLAAYSGTFLLFLYICAVVGQQLFSGKFVTCDYNQLISRQDCNAQVFILRRPLKGL